LKKEYSSEEEEEGEENFVEEQRKISSRVRELIAQGPIQSGVVVIEGAQQGIDQSDTGEFIEIKSKRKEREQRIKEKESKIHKKTKKDKNAIDKEKTI